MWVVGLWGFLLLSTHTLSTCEAGAPAGPESVFNDAGYIRVGGLGRELFYWLFESRSQPATDPLVVWLSGGPGCSSMLALFSENGPYQVKGGGAAAAGGAPPRLRLNPWSWNANATVVWVDQPAGTGFSVGMPVHNEDQVADGMWSFLQGLYRRYPRYQALPLYIFGESYAGHYVPHVSAAVLQRNAQLAADAVTHDDNTTSTRRQPSAPALSLEVVVEEEATPVHVNLKGMAIGNGLTNPAVQFRYYYKYAQEKGLVDDAQLAIMRAILPLCEALTLACNVPIDNKANTTARALEYTACLNAYVFCNLGELVPVQSTGVNVYDTRERCDPDQKLCYDFSPVAQYLNTPAALGSKKRKGEWQDCSPIVDLALVYGGDWTKGYEGDVAYVLDQGGLPVLIYAGVEDYICNWMGNFAWTKALRWSGHRDFHRSGNVTWRRPSDGQVAGYYVTGKGSKGKGGRLTYLSVLGAGHLVPMDQPQSSLDMMLAFITHGQLEQQEDDEDHQQDKGSSMMDMMDGPGGDGDVSGANNNNNNNKMLPSSSSSSSSRLLRRGEEEERRRKG